ncbi:MAG: 3D domain-containing protein [Phycisphaerales bacterium]
MQDTARHKLPKRAIAEFFGFAILAGVTVGSAISAKHSMAGAPALTRLAGGAVESPIPAIAGAAERTVGQSGEIDFAAIESAPSLLEGESDAPVDGARVDAPELVDAEIRYFDGRPIRPARTIMMTVTAYSPDAKSCGIWADGVTASNKSIWTNAMKLVAADTSVLPFGSLLSIPGYDHGSVVPVLDRGGAIKGDRLDVLYPTHEIALEWGVQRLPITVWEYADED